MERSRRALMRTEEARPRSRCRRRSSAPGPDRCGPRSAWRLRRRANVSATHGAPTLNRECLMLDDSALRRIVKGMRMPPPGHQLVELVVRSSFQSAARACLVNQETQGFAQGRCSEFQAFSIHQTRPSCRCRRRSDHSPYAFRHKPYVDLAHVVASGQPAAVAGKSQMAQELASMFQGNN